VSGRKENTEVHIYLTKVNRGKKWKPFFVGLLRGGKRWYADLEVGRKRKSLSREKKRRGPRSGERRQA